MEWKDLITKIIPEINDIQNEKLRNQVICAWEYAYNDSKWTSPVDEIPFNDKIGWVTLIKHTRSVTQEAVLMSKHIKETYDVDFDMDKVLAIAILHDCCKAVETQPDEDNKSVKSQMGHFYPHGTMSMYYAKKAGLPDDVCHAILAHTSTGKLVPQIIEGLIVRYVDAADADTLYFMSKLPTLLERNSK